MSEKLLVKKTTLTTTKKEEHPKSFVTNFPNALHILQQRDLFVLESFSYLPNSTISLM